MRFNSVYDQRQAMRLLTIYAPKLFLLFERRIAEAGFIIQDRAYEKTSSGEVIPVLTVKSARLTSKLYLRNSLDEFLTLDREDEPSRLDHRLVDPAYAQKKLADIVDGRIALLIAMNESKSQEEFKVKIKALVSRFAYLRYWYNDKEESK